MASKLGPPSSLPTFMELVMSDKFDEDITWRIIINCSEETKPPFIVQFELKEIHKDRKPPTFILDPQLIGDEIPDRTFVNRIQKFSVERPQDIVHNFFQLARMTNNPFNEASYPFDPWTALEVEVGGSGNFKPLSYLRAELQKEKANASKTATAS